MNPLWLNVKILLKLYLIVKMKMILVLYLMPRWMTLPLIIMISTRSRQLGILKCGYLIVTLFKIMLLMDRNEILLLELLLTNCQKLSLMSISLMLVSIFSQLSLNIWSRTTTKMVVENMPNITHHILLLKSLLTF